MRFQGISGILKKTKAGGSAIKKALYLILFFILGAGFSFSEDESTNDSSYLALLERVKAGDKAVDFRELRFSYASTSLYAPYGGNKKGRLKVIEAFKKKNYKAVTNLAEKVFDTDYLDLNTHYMCMLAHQNMGNAEKADFHEFVLNGIIDSIVSFGDGRSPETAYEVITTREEEFIITTLGFVTVTREEIRTKNHIVDKVFASSLADGKNKILYFNKDVPNRWLNKKYSSPEEKDNDDTKK